MSATLTPPLAVGDRVYLATDPRKDEGTVVKLLNGRYFVRWDNGHTWVYAAIHLVRL